MYHYNDMVMLRSAAMYTCGFDIKPAAAGRQQRRWAASMIVSSLETQRLYELHSSGVTSLSVRHAGACCRAD